MDTKLDAIDKLIAAVEGGGNGWTGRTPAYICRGGMATAAASAYAGSLDTALSLHHAVAVVAHQVGASKIPSHFHGTLFP